MEPLSLLAAAGAFVAAEAAKMVGGMAVEKAFGGVKSLLKSYLGREPRPADFTPAVVQTMAPAVQPAFIQQAQAVIASSPAMQRAALIRPVLEGANVLWVDDVPARNAYEQQVLLALGMHVEWATSTEEALALASRTSYDVILSDMARDQPDAGLLLLQQLRRARCKTPVIFYVGKVDLSRPTPVGAFGIADAPEPLLHYVFDVLERGRIARARAQH